MSLRKFSVILVSTFFYVGFLPFIPGTFGSLAGLAVFYLIKNNSLFYLLVMLFLIILGFLVSGKAEGVLGRKDARPIVIDEVCGMLLSLIFIPYDFKLVVMGFFLFRLLDTLKPYPACYLQRLKGSTGVMGDDIIAGLYTNIILQAVLRFASFRTS